MKRIVVAVLLFVSACQLSAQSNQKDTIRSVTVTGKRVLLSPPSVQTFDTAITDLYQQTTLQHMLQLHSNVFVKNYGAGGYSTISIRGSSAAQTQVLWQGVNINNSLSGISDMSVLPVSFFDQISIDYGNDLRNQSMSGAIHLQQAKPSFYKHQQMIVALGAESMNNYNALVSCKQSGRRMVNHVRLSQSIARNEYRFYNLELGKMQPLEHAHGNQTALMNDTYLQLGGAQVLSFHVWAQRNQRDIPPATFEEWSERNEVTKSLRMMLKYEQSALKKRSFNANLASLLELYQYQDGISNQTFRAAVHTVPFTFQWSVKLKPNHRFSIQSMSTLSYILDRSSEQIKRSGLAANYSMENLWQRVDLRAGVQQEMADRFKLPLSASAALQFKLANGLKAFASISNRYRVPTLNELFYFPGGNIHLKPERSKNLEGGFQTKQQKQRQMVEAEVTCFMRRVEDWIAWFGGAILTPHNIQEVHSRGVEVMASYAYNFRSRYRIGHGLDSNGLIEVIVANQQKPAMGLSAFCNVFYAYTLSTTESSAFTNDYSIGKQIPYVPRYQGKIQVGCRTNGLELSYVQTYTGYRFITTDESQYLTPYFTGNMLMAYTLARGMNTWKFTIRLNNLFNANYESVVGRVMPGRNGSVGMMWKRR